MGKLEKGFWSVEIQVTERQEAPSLRGRCIGDECDSEHEEDETERGSNDNKKNIPLLNSMNPAVFGNKSGDTGNINDDGKPVVEASARAEEDKFWLYVGGGIGGGSLLLLLIMGIVCIRRRKPKLEKTETIDENPDYGDTYYDGRTQVMDEND